MYICMSVCIYPHSYINEVIPLGLTMLPTRVINYLPTTSVMRNLISSHWSRGDQETPKTVYVIVFALACFPEVKGKSLLLKTPNTSHQDSEGSRWN